MARQDGRIEKGQRLSSAISARAWNRAQAAADVVLGGQPGAEADGPSLRDWPFTWIYCVNNAGVDLARFNVVELADPYVQRNLNGAQTDAVRRGLVMNAVVPSSRQPWANSFANTNGMISNEGGFNGPPPPVRWGVVVEPIPIGMTGRVAVSGVVLVKANAGPGLLASSPTPYAADWPQSVPGGVGELFGNMRVTTKDGSVTPVIDYVGEADVLWANIYTNTTTLQQGEYWALIKFSAPTPPQILSVAFDGTWESNAMKTVTVLGPGPYDPPNVNARNPFGTVSTTGPSATSQFCSVAVVNREWRMITMPPKK